MILVYTDSWERATVLLTAIGGLQYNHRLITLANLDDYLAYMKDEFDKDNYMATHFCRDTMAFIYVNSEDIGLCKMADYDDSFKKVSARPIPFLPENMMYKSTLDSQKETTLMKLVEMASSVVNAASDNMQGNLNFAHFRLLMLQNGIEIDRVKRLHVQSMTATNIIEALQETIGSPGKDDLAERAALLWEKVNWLIHANVSNLIVQKLGAKPLVITGLIESLFMEFAISNMGVEQQPNQEVQLAIRGIPVSKNTYTLKTTSGQYVDVNTLKSEKIIIDRYAPNSKQNITALNIFQLQNICKNRLALSTKEIAETVEWLFLHGYITHPSKETKIAGNCSSFLNDSVAMVATLPGYIGRIAPCDATAYEGWHGKKDVEHRRLPILLTSKPLAPGVNDTAGGIYQIIAEATACMVKANTVYETIEAHSDTQCVVLTRPVEFEKKTEKMPRWKKKSAETNSQTVKIGDSYEIQRAKPLHITDSKGIKEGGIVQNFYHAFLNKACLEDEAILFKPIENLVEWNQLQRGDADLVTCSKGILPIYDILKGVVQIADIDYIGQLVFEEILRTDVIAVETKAIAFVQEIVERYQKRLSSFEEIDRIPIALCKCPVCGGGILPFYPDGAMAWTCNSAQCGFMIPREISGHTMTSKDVAQLLSRGLTDKISIFSAKDKKEKLMRLGVVRNQQGMCFVDITQASIHRCPRCGGQMQESEWGIKCYNKQCAFAIPYAFCGIRLQDEDVALLISGQKTREIEGMISKQGKQFSASLQYDPLFQKMGFHFS